MIFDIVIAVIIALAVIKGFRRGLFYMTLRILVWVGAVIAGIFLTGTLAEFLSGGPVGERVSADIADKLGSSMSSATDACAGLPDMISGGIKAAENSTVTLLADTFTTMVTSVLAFGIIVFGIWLIAHIFMVPASRRRRKSVIGAADRLAGAAAGAVKGIIVVFILLALLVPVVNLSDPGTSAAIMSQLASSQFAGIMYDNNLLLLVADSVIS